MSEAYYYPNKPGSKEEAERALHDRYYCDDHSRIPVVERLGVGAVMALFPWCILVVFMGVRGMMTRATRSTR